MKKNNYQIIKGDCLSETKKIKSNTIDAIITDPPYCSNGFTESSRMRSRKQGIITKRLKDINWFPCDNMTTVGITWLIREASLEFYRVLGVNTSLLMFTDWRMITNIVPVIESAGFQYRNLIVWNKMNPGLGNGFRPAHEIVMHFVKGKAKFYAKDGVNVITIRRIYPTKKIHHTQKPVELMEKLIRVTTPDGGTVLDPFCGSASTGEACLNLNRLFIGIEKDLVHYEIAVDRMAKFQKQMEETN